jgi:3-phytase
VAEVIHRVRPDVLLINEFDFDAEGLAARLFQHNYLSVGHNGVRPIAHRYRFVAPVQHRHPLRLRLDNNGAVGGPNDAFGFGAYPGQFGMAVYSRYPILRHQVRTSSSSFWEDMPGALLPDHPATPAPADWYSAQELAVFRLSSKSHWDLPVLVGGKVVHTLVSHPTHRCSTVPRTATAPATTTRSASGPTMCCPPGAGMSTTMTASGAASTGGPGS